MRNLLLFTGAFILLIIGIIFVLPIRLIDTIIKKTIKEFLYYLALGIDYLLCVIWFGVVGHTISAYCYYKRKTKMIQIINWIFQDKYHCQKAYNDEFIKN